MEKGASNVLRVFVAEGKCLTSRFLATIVAIHRDTDKSFVAPIFLLSGVRGLHIHTDSKAIS
jgi:hypothetical protein